jgi:hypothetical protein
MSHFRGGPVMPALLPAWPADRLPLILSLMCHSERSGGISRYDARSPEGPVSDSEIRRKLGLTIAEVRHNRWHQLLYNARRRAHRADQRATELGT